MSGAQEKSAYHYNLGVLYEKKNDPAAAKDEYRKAIEADPEFPYPYKSLGEIYSREGNLDAALSELSMALKLDPEWVEVLALAAGVLYDKGEIPRAIHFQEKAAAKAPRNAGYAAALGRMLISDGRFSDAIEVLERALDADGDKFLVHYNLGVAHGKRAMSDMDRSIENWKKARRLNPDDPQVHRNLGIAYFTKGLLEEARASFRRALELNPSDEASRKYLKYSEAFK
ncbi:MAG: tetratricopeptide repeat protein [bacterium]